MLYWVEKMQGKKEMTPAEPLGDIHMPNGSILPFIISFGLFVAAFGFLYHPDGVSWSVPVMIIGLESLLLVPCYYVPSSMTMVTIFIKQN